MAAPLPKHTHSQYTSCSLIFLSLHWLSSTFSIKMFLRLPNRKLMTHLAWIIYLLVAKSCLLAFSPLLCISCITWSVLSHQIPLGQALCVAWWKERGSDEWHEFESRLFRCECLMKCWKICLDILNVMQVSSVLREGNSKINFLIRKKSEGEKKCMQ